MARIRFSPWTGSPGVVETVVIPPSGGPITGVVGAVAGSSSFAGNGTVTGGGGGPANPVVNGGGNQVINGAGNNVVNNA